MCAQPQTAPSQHPRTCPQANHRVNVPCLCLGRGLVAGMPVWCAAPVLKWVFQNTPLPFHTPPPFYPSPFPQLSLNVPCLCRERGPGAGGHVWCAAPQARPRGQSSKRKSIIQTYPVYVLEEVLSLECAYGVQPCEALCVVLKDGAEGQGIQSLQLTRRNQIQTLNPVSTVVVGWALRGVG